jgi:hypothetical protein
MRSTSTKAGLAGLAAAAIAFAVAASAPAGLSLNTRGWSSHLTARQVSALSQGPTSRVIVLMRNQHTGLQGRHFLAQRAQAFHADQVPVVAQLEQLNVPRLVTYRTLNAVATSVTDAEKANLLRNPAVLAVAPDSVVKGPSSNADLLASVGAPRSSTSPTGMARRARTGSAANPAVCGTASAPLLEPEALHLINADNRTNANAPITSGPASAHSLGYDGKGVSIAVFPDGMDPNLPDFIRPDSSHAVTDYKDFTGEGTNAVTGGEEAFGDVGSIVAQGQQTYNLQQEINPDFAGPGACDIKVLGVAPGANVDVMKVFGTTNFSFTSEVLEGIDYAIQHDHVNILSLSLGFFALPTTAAQQPVTQIVENAMADGTTVVASTGDASPSNTESAPALAPGVIGTAASTSYRIFAQTNLFLYDMGEAIKNAGNAFPSYTLGQSTPGWLDNQVSTLSSSGVTEDGRTADILAPGDVNWAECSTDTSKYTECVNSFGGTPIGIFDFGGTSESAPLTSGTAALVIQAYREGHKGKTPSPAVVRQILYASATDIGVAAADQGAGLLNALRAVRMAKVYGSHGSGGGLVFSQTSFSDVGKPGATRTHNVTVTNNGNVAATVKPQLRTLGAEKTLAQGSASLFEAGSGLQGTCAGVDYAEYFNGDTIPELNCLTITVPKGVDKLDARIAWNPLEPCPDTDCTAGPPTVRAVLIDPNGRYGQYSDPQGLGGGFADEQIHQPAAGNWTLMLFGRGTSPYEGPVSYSVTAQRFTTIPGAVSPVSKVLGPGKSATFAVKVKAPSTAGFFTGAVVFNSNKEKAVGTIPVVSQSTVPVTTKKAGHFTGWLTGGNARQSFFGQQLSYRFVVPKGVHDVDVNLGSADDGYMLMAQLVDPTGHAVDSQLSSQNVTPYGDPSNTHSVQLVWANPAPGTWKVNVQNGLFFLPGLATYSGLTRSQLRGTVSFNKAKVDVFGLPGGTLSPGAHVTTHITVKNTGNEPEFYQLDPRLTASHQYEAVAENNVSSGTLPITDAANVPVYGVPPFSSKFQMTASTSGSTPIVFDASPYWGSPNVTAAPSTAGSTSVTINDPIASTWAPTISEVGPFGATAETPENFSTSGTLSTLRIDDNATVSTGNIWSAIVDGTNNLLNPLFLLPGQSGTMAVTFTVPNGVAGTKISGVIPVETFELNSLTTGVGDWSSDILKVVHYSYKIG